MPKRQTTSLSLSLSHISLKNEYTGGFVPISLHALKITTQVILVQVALLYLLCHLPFPLACLLRVLQLEAVLVHGEPHSLWGKRNLSVAIQIWGRGTTGG